MTRHLEFALRSYALKLAEDTHQSSETAYMHLVAALLNPFTEKRIKSEIVERYLEEIGGLQQEQITAILEQALNQPAQYKSFCDELSLDAGN